MLSRRVVVYTTICIRDRSTGRFAAFNQTAAKAKDE